MSSIREVQVMHDIAEAGCTWFEDDQGAATVHQVWEMCVAGFVGMPTLDGDVLFAELTPAGAAFYAKHGGMQHLPLEAGRVDRLRRAIDAFIKELES